MNDYKPDWAERIQRSRTRAFGEGHKQGVSQEKERIINDLQKDAVVITNLDVKLLERIIEIVEG